jgi:hypothetical protein
MKFVRSANRVAKMLTLSVNLFKSGRKYKATLTAEDNGSVINSDDWGEINPNDKLARRVKIVNLSGKSLGICLNVLNSSHDKKKVSKTKKVKNKI